ncbi:MAG TPA: glutamyl-tRNA reductase [Candidatus Rubrimentiphilum sp.]|nr:glutamyl-tRNA reductase [Candidatus Rubrimentiphilum sp.]
MPLVCLGLSHNTAPVEVRERHVFPAARMSEALVALRDYEAVREALMLQTCGRLEIYAEVADYEAGVAQLKSFLLHFRHGSVAYDLESYLYTLLGREAAEHLFRVSTGLDSMLIGEAEILGQVKEAYALAREANSAGEVLHKLLREAMSAGKAARTQTRIGEESPSVATAAIDLAKRRFGSLEGRSVLVVGAGKMGGAAAKRFRREGARNVAVLSRTLERTREVIAQIGAGEALEPGELLSALTAADIVITSTGAAHFVLTPEIVAQALEKRAERPLFIIDIAVPRDAHPAVGELPNVTLVDIDGLKMHVDEKLEVRREAIPQVEEIVGEYVGRFRQWYKARATVPVIASLTRKAEAIRAAELERLFARLPDLGERDRMLMTGASLTIISKLLHTVVTKLREKASEESSEALTHAKLLQELFELDVADR